MATSARLVLASVLALLLTASCAASGARPTPTSEPTAAPSSPSAPASPETSPVPTAGPTNPAPSSPLPTPPAPVSTAPLAADTLRPVVVPPVPEQGSTGLEARSAIADVTAVLRNYITNSLASLQRDAPRNPGLAAEFQAKIALLQDPALYDSIVNGAFFLVDSAPSIDGSRVALVAVFPTAEVRAEAWYALQLARLSLSVLEDFMSVPYPTNRITLYYGFVVGSSGGAGLLSLEDKTTYLARWRAGMMPYDPVIVHEVSHAYIGHEGLNQFLEIYAYNTISVRSPSLTEWTFVRDYRTWTGTKTGYASLLDVYQLIGLPAMQRAYQALFELGPAYGQPLPAACKQAFVDQAPDALKAQVQSLVGNITY